MAHISFDLRPDDRPVIHDSPSEPFPGKRHAWIQLRDQQGSDLNLGMGYGCPTDAQIIASSGMLIEALETLRDAARQRTMERVVHELNEAARAEGIEADAPLADPTTAALLQYQAESR